MKKIMNYASAFLLATAVLVTSCSKPEEVEPDPNPNAQVITSVINPTNMGNTGTANVVATVSTSDGVAKLRIEVQNASNNLNQLFMTVSEDNGTPSGYIAPTIKNSYGTFSGSNSDYTLKIPGLKNFIVDIPVNIRTAGVTDVYTIWLTNGDGSFTKPTKNRDLGMAKITLKYSAAASTNTFTEFSGVVGNQLAVEPSFIVTSGKGGTMLQVDYKNDLDPENALSVDISFASLNAGDNALGTVANLVSPSVREAVGFAAGNEPDAANTNVTYFGSWSGTAFASATADDLATITGLSATTIDIADNGTYAFITEAGKKGLIKVGTIANSGTSGKKFSFTIKVLN